jgi:UDP-N-acetylglucosamine 4,6-dehydratase
MCPADDAHLTVEFRDHYVIRPSINFVEAVDYLVDNLGEAGHPVDHGFEYNSFSNSHYLTVEELRALNEATGQKTAAMAAGIR